jgi:uncharacterized protein (UPF0332 family)
MLPKMALTRESLLQTESDAHLRLARLFLTSAVLATDANEAQVRNSLSRAYYALFHFCNALLVYLDVPPKGRSHHGPLKFAVSQHVGVEAMERLRLFQRRREDADYKIRILESEYKGDLDRYRAFANASVQEIRDVIVGYEQLIESAKRKVVSGKDSQAVSE